MFSCTGCLMAFSIILMSRATITLLELAVLNLYICERSRLRARLRPHVDALVSHGSGAL